MFCEEEIALLAAKKKATKKQTKSQQAAQYEITPMKKTAKKKLAGKGRYPEETVGEEGRSQKGGGESERQKVKQYAPETQSEEKPDCGNSRILTEGSGSTFGWTVRRFAGLVQRRGRRFGEC